MAKNSISLNSFGMTQIYSPFSSISSCSVRRMKKDGVQKGFSFTNCFLVLFLRKPELVEPGYC